MKPHSRERKDLIFFLLLQAVTVVLVMLGFKNIAQPIFAGLFGGALFISMSVWNLWRMWQWPKVKTSPTFWITLLFLGGVAFPMVIQRLLNMDRPFDQIEVWHIRGPDFHIFASRIYSVMMVTTLLEWGVRSRAKSNQDSKEILR